MRNYIYVGLNSFVTLLIGIITYKILWESTSNLDFSRWISIFEISIALLLLDLGFTNNFIKKNSNNFHQSKILIFEFKKLTNSLNFVGVIAFLMLILLSFVLQVDLLVSFLLGGSVLFGLMSYGSLVIFKLDERFSLISLISMVSNFIYLLICLSVFFFKVDVITLIAFGVFFRSFFSYFIQRYYLKNFYRYLFLWEGSNKFYPPDFKVIAFNFSYFLLYIFDIFILNLLGGGAALLLFIIYKKYFEVVRGVLESFLSIYMIRFAKTKDGIKRKEFYLIFSIFLISFFSAFFIIPTWFSGFEYNYLHSLIVMLNVMLIFLYRAIFMNLYFKGYNQFNINIGLILVIKSLIFSLIYFYGSFLFEFYFLHFVLILILLVFLIKRGCK